jgi:hypothetical protein
LLEKEWLNTNIPHIASVLSDVKQNEGVEITINCNVQAFSMILTYLKAKDLDNESGGSALEEFIGAVNDENCLNLLVSTNFLGLDYLY